MCICAAPSYLARKGTPRTVKELANHERLAFAPHGRALPWRLRDGTSIRDVEPGNRIAVDDAQALVDLAVGGAGLAWVCDFMMAQGRKTGALVELLDETACQEQPIHALSLPTRNAVPKVRAFAAFAAKELEGSHARRG
jgi:LysR family transcriptional regulator for bpeEF and oprC